MGANEVEASLETQGAEAELALLEVEPGVAVLFGEAAPEGWDVEPFGLGDRSDREIVDALSNAVGTANAVAQGLGGFVSAQGLVRLAPETIRNLRTMQTVTKDGYYLGALKESGKFAASVRWAPAAGAQESSGSSSPSSGGGSCGTGVPSEKVAGPSQLTGARPCCPRWSCCPRCSGCPPCPSCPWPCWDCRCWSAGPAGPAGSAGAGADGDGNGDGDGEDGAAPPGSVGRACKRWTVAIGDSSTGSGAGGEAVPDGEATETAEAAEAGDAIGSVAVGGAAEGAAGADPAESDGPGPGGAEPGEAD